MTRGLVLCSFLALVGCTEHGKGGGTLALCGNGMVDEDEVCDDGNDVNGDGCSEQCTIEACGNAILDVGEVCDDGNNLAGDGCSPNCMSTEVCGNLILDPGEVCDDGNNPTNDECPADCGLGG